MCRGGPTNGPFSPGKTWNKLWRPPTDIRPWRPARWASRFVNCATGSSNWKWTLGDFVNDIVAQCRENLDKCHGLFAGRRQIDGPAGANEWPGICFRVIGKGAKRRPSASRPWIANQQPFQSIDELSN